MTKRGNQIEPKVKGGDTTRPEEDDDDDNPVPSKKPHTTADAPPHVEIDSRFRDGYVIEDDDFVSLRIREMKEEINRMNTDTGLSYRLALIKAPEQCDDAFHLMCLRSEYFHPIFSAKRAVRYWQMRIDLFGIDRGYKSLDEINESASPEENKWKQYLFFTEQNDDRGRPIFRTKFLGEMFPSTIDEWDKERDNILRVFWRGFEQLISDEFAQKYGAVCVNEAYGMTLEAKYMKKLMYLTRSCFPIKWMQIHMIVEPSFKYFLYMAYQNVIGQRFQSRQIFHSTDKALTLNVLESRFGIPRCIFEDWEIPNQQDAEAAGAEAAGAEAADAVVVAEDTNHPNQELNVDEPNVVDLNPDHVQQNNHA